MKHLKSFIFLVLLFSCSMYTYWLSNYDYEWIVPYMNDRAPAAVRESKEFLEIVEKPMRVFKREAVVDSIAIQDYFGKRHLSMGQFPVATGKAANLVCLEFPIVKLSFVGEGSAVAGKQTRFSIMAPCRIHPRNHEMVSDIPIPLDEIYRRPAQAQDFNWPNQMLDIDVHIDEVYGDWPKLWQLESVEFHKDSNPDGEKLTLSKQEFLKKTGSPILLK